ncbi:hypothetical protein MTR72_39155 [Bradyrhizobium sp. ISRA442]
MYSGSESSYAISYNSATQTLTIVDQRSGSPDGSDTVTGVEYFGFADVTIASSALVAPSTIESFGSTSLVQYGGNYYLDLVSGGTGPVLKYNGSAVAVSQFGAAVPIGAEATASGYEVAWKVTGADVYAVWNTDTNGNYLNNVLSGVSGSIAALQSLELSFHQDLNGDNVIGLNIPSTVIESFGSTSLVQYGANYFLNPTSGGTGPELSYNGSPVIAGQFGAAVPIGVEATTSGYEVAWKVAGLDAYAVWNTDANGNYLNNAVSGVSGASAALQSLEPSFHQDLNGDSVIGLNIPSTTIEAFGSTKLVQYGASYYFNPTSGGMGPELKYNGAAVVAGQFGAATPIGVEATASGYEVAWKVAGADAYAVWTTDTNGNYLNNAISGDSGSSAVLQSLEPSFQQDLNGDHVTGLNISGTVIESFGSTSLVQYGANYYFNPISGGLGPELKYSGAPVVAGQFGAATPIGVEATTSGYEVAWKVVGADLYAVWNTDTNGNYLNNAVSGVSGNSIALQSLEPSFQQDLNANSQIGVSSGQSPTASISSSDSFSFSSGSSTSYDASHPVVPSYANGLLASASEQSLSALFATLANNTNAVTPDDNAVLYTLLEHFLLH